MAMRDRWCKCDIFNDDFFCSPMLCLLLKVDSLKLHLQGFWYAFELFLSTLERNMAWKNLHCYQSFALCFFFKCSIRSFLVVNAELRTEHLWDFSSLSLITCFFNFADGQRGHWKGFLPSCCLMWFVRLLFRAKADEHFSYLKGFSPLWVFIWRFNKPFS